MNPTRLIQHVLRRRWSRRLARDERGTTAVEFVIVAAPFFALIFAILEAGFNYMAASSLDHALRLSTRLMQTGSAQQANMSEEQFRIELCNRLPSLMSCERVKLDLRPIRIKRLPSFVGRSDDGLAGDVKIIQPEDDESAVYCPGRPGDYMLARALFELPNFMGMAISRKVSGPSGDVYVVEASRVFRNEPFSPVKSTC